MPIRVKFSGYVAELSDDGLWSVLELDMPELGPELARTLNAGFPPGSVLETLGYHPWPALAQAEAAAAELGGEILEAIEPEDGAPESDVF